MLHVFWMYFTYIFMCFDPSWSLCSFLVQLLLLKTVVGVRELFAGSHVPSGDATVASPPKFIGNVWSWQNSGPLGRSILNICRLITVTYSPNRWAVFPAETVFSGAA